MVGTIARIHLRETPEFEDAKRYNIADTVGKANVDTKKITK